MSSYASPIQAVIERLKWHIENHHGLLSGVKFKDYPRVETIGKADLPEVRLFIPDFTETHNMRRLLTCSINLNLLVATVREKGIAELTGLAEKVLDALEIGTDLAIDARINGSLRYPFSWKTDKSFAEDVSSNLQIVLTMVPAKTPLRGKRRL
jgi:hypothetical protein